MSVVDAVWTHAEDEDWSGADGEVISIVGPFLAVLPFCRDIRPIGICLQYEARSGMSGCRLCREKLTPFHVGE